MYTNEEIAHMYQKWKDSYFNPEVTKAEQIELYSK